MRFFDWIKSKWNGVDKDPPDACFHLTFLCQDPEHHVCVDKPEPAQENKRKVYPRKRLAKQRTRKRGIERRRVIINCFDQDVENFINEILVFDDVSRIEKPMIYEEYEITKKYLFKLTGHNELMAEYPVEQLSVDMREKMILPLVTIQQYAMAKIREMEQEDIKDHLKPTYEKLAMRCSFGIINAGRNSA